MGPFIPTSAAVRMLPIRPISSRLGWYCDSMIDSRLIKWLSEADGKGLLHGGDAVPRVAAEGIEALRNVADMEMVGAEGGCQFVPCQRD